MWRLIIKDLRQLLSNKVLIGFCILIVLASVVVVNIGFKEKEKKKDTIVVGIVNEDHGNKYSKMLVDFFGLDQSFSSMVKMKYSNSQKEMAEKFKKGEVQAYIVIPKGFIDDLVHISESKIKVIINQQDSTSAIILGNVLKSYET